MVFEPKSLKSLLSSAFYNTSSILWYGRKKYQMTGAKRFQFSKIVIRHNVIVIEESLYFGKICGTFLLSRLMAVRNKRMYLNEAGFRPGRSYVN